MGGLDGASIVAICTVLGASIAVATVFWKAATWKGGVDLYLKEFDKHRDTVADYMKEIRDEFRDVRNSVNRLFRELPKHTVESASPKRLNDLGKKVAEHVGAEEWAVARAGPLAVKCEGMEPYEIDGFASDYVYGENFFNENEAMSAEALRAAYVFGINEDSVFAVLHIVLRDELLKLLGKSDPS